MFSSLQMLTKLKENLYETYATGCHQIPGILNAVIVAFALVMRSAF
jgi:hypothetical protein